MDTTNKGTAPAHSYEEIEREKDEEIDVAMKTVLLAALTISLLSPIAAYIAGMAHLLD